MSGGTTRTRRFQILTGELEGFVEAREEQRPLVPGEVDHFLLHLLRVEPLLGVDALSTASRTS